MATMARTERKATASAKPASQDSASRAGYVKFQVRWRHVQLIDDRIRSGRPVTCKTLADELEVSRRTVLRDIDFLRYDLGAPVEFDAKRNSYVYTQPNWSLPNIRMTEGDLFALMVAEKALHAYAGTPWAETLKRIFERIIAGLPERVEIAPEAMLPRVTFSGDAIAIIDPKVLAALHTAMRENQTLCMRYYALKRNEERTYTIDPYLLRQARGAWYLVGRDHGNGQIPMFNLSRIREIEPTGATFDYDMCGFDPAKYFAGTFSVQESSERHDVAIEFTGPAAQRVRERYWHASQKLTELPDNRLRLELEISSLDDILPWVLSWGGDAQVVSPATLVDLVKSQVDSLTERYFRSPLTGKEPSINSRRIE
jgi:proteasome accessory factor B